MNTPTVKINLTIFKVASLTFTVMLGYKIGKTTSDYAWALGVEAFDRVTKKFGEKVAEIPNKKKRTEGESES